MPNTVPAAATGLPVKHQPPGLAQDALYGLAVVGNCMTPLIKDGEAVVCDPHQPYAAGDIVVIYYRSAADEVGAAVKRLALGVDPCVTFPFRPNPLSTVLPLIAFECLDPPQRFAACCTKVLGIHKVIGKRTPDGRVDAALIEANAKHWKAQLRAASHSRKARMTGAVA